MPLTAPSPLTPTALADWINQLLEVDAFQDYCPNGLQVDADQPIQKIITGVTASQALIEHAIEANAQAILVHHGYFWKGETAPLIGMKGKRIRLLMQHGISLLAYHLPLDAHPTLGNNTQLAKQLGFTLTEPLYPHEKKPVGNIANLAQAIDIDELRQNIAQQLGREPLHLAGGNAQVKRIGICTGSAQDMLEQAVTQGCDAFISGEVSERTTHIARELGIEYLACGHHATERGGVKALGEHIAQQFGLTVEFVDIDNPV
ncbi:MULTISPECIES: Nif3-like dinuclear metal center hexameric protein [unclassified Moraxella]|uniref:Nif3-like dinuclear metal center hexameric protein n=1 Tax=unclassified Moraxella TaxID=2685852 RepID=UPI003AF6FF7F